jgi:multiple sugar transport system permease protein
MPVAIAVIWKFIYNPLYGPIAILFQSLGLEPISWLTDVKYGLLSIVVIAVWSGIGYHMIIMLAGLQNIDRSYYDAAQVDGANKWQQFTFITLPLLTPTLFFTVITSFINGFQMFDLVYIMTKGGPMNSTRTIVMYIYEEGIRNFRFGASNAAAWVLFIIIMSITLFQLRIQDRWVHYE